MQIVQVGADLPSNRCNDGQRDPAGRFWIGAMSNDGPVADAGALYRPELDARLTRVLGGLTIANGMSCARSTLELRFQVALGRTIASEIRRVRVARAEQLGRETRLPLKQVAARSGFRSVQHMTTIFGQRVGKTPAKLRRASEV